MDDVLILMKEAFTTDARGIRKATFTERQVFCQVHSISRSEFYDAGRNGLSPEYEFTVFAGDYDGERTCKYSGSSYAIYRTYRVPGTDYMELYAQTEGGTNGK